MGIYSMLKPCHDYIQRCYINYNNMEIVDGDYGANEEFESDLDGIMCSNAFRRLSSKTQIFYSQTKDDLRTRLTHTLEVAQIARKISKPLGLDDSLTEAIALGHDVGHTPFGHVGERTLNKFSQGWDKKQSADKVYISRSKVGFKHNLQSVRSLVDYSGHFSFSNFMLFGVREHSRLYWNKPEDVSFYQIYEKCCSYDSGGVLYPAWSFEAFVVKWADEIAQRHHDLEDAYFQKIMTADEIVDILYPLSTIETVDTAKARYDRLLSAKKQLMNTSFTDYNHSFTKAITDFTIGVYVDAFIDAFSSILRSFCEVNEIRCAEDYKEQYLSIDLEQIRNAFKLEQFGIYNIDLILGESLKNNILDSYSVQKMDGKGAYVVRKLVRAFLSNPQQLPNEYINRLIKSEIMREDNKHYIVLQGKILSKLSNYDVSKAASWKDYECREVLRVFVEDSDCRTMIYDNLLRIVIDYVAGMTDRYAMNRYKELY